MNSRDRMDEAQERAVALKRAEGEKKWDNGVYDPAKFAHNGPKASDFVQMVIENRDSPEPEVRPFLITQVLDASTGLVNGMLFMANSDIRQGEAGILGGGMSQAIRQAGFVVPEAVKGGFWLDRVHFHPRGLPRQQTQRVEKGGYYCADCRHFNESHKINIDPFPCMECQCMKFKPSLEIVEELLWDSPGVPMLEATWRWAQCPSG